MKKILALSTRLLLGGLLVINVIVTEGQPSSSSEEMSEVHQHIIKSKINGVTYHLSVSLPKHYSSMKDLRYPVLYYLDGNVTFPIAFGTRVILDWTGEIEDVIIVGVGYSKLSIIPLMTSRWTDYTPSSNVKTDSSFLGPIGVPAGSLTSGGGPVFLNVLRKEIFPFIETQYKTTDDRGIAGNSFGGLFAGYCLISAPDLFHRYGINSPSFWWDNGYMFPLEKSFSKGNRFLNANVFMSVGSLEGEWMVPKMIAFADSLKHHNYNGLTLTTQLFDNETHVSVIPASISRTLRVLYGVKEKKK